MTTPLEAVELIARKQIGDLRTSQLPIAPIKLVDVVMSSMISDPYQCAMIIMRIALSDFNLFINSEGEIDFPPEESQPIIEEKIQTRYQEPKISRGIPPLEKNRLYRRGRVEKDPGQE